VVVRKTARQEPSHNHEHEAFRPLCRLLPRLDSTSFVLMKSLLLSWPRGNVTRPRGPKDLNHAAIASSSPGGIFVGEITFIAFTNPFQQTVSVINFSAPDNFPGEISVSKMHVSG
jgi:hypothetical protein